MHVMCKLVCGHRQLLPQIRPVEMQNHFTYTATLHLNPWVAQQDKLRGNLGNPIPPQLDHSESCFLGEHGVPRTQT